MTAAVFPKTPPGARLFRSGAARFFGWAWMVFAAANLADLAWRGRDVASLIATGVILLGCGVAYLVALRPRIVADDDGVRLYNLVRDVRAPWGSVERVEGGDAVYLHHGDRRYRAFVLQTSPRTRARAEVKSRRKSAADEGVHGAVADYLRGRTATDFTVEQLRELLEKNHTKPETAPAPTVAWAWPPIAAVAVPALLTLVGIILALT